MHAQRNRISGRAPVSLAVLALCFAPSLIAVGCQRPTAPDTETPADEPREAGPEGSEAAEQPSADPPSESGASPVVARSTNSTRATSDDGESAAGTDPAAEPPVDDDGPGPTLDEAELALDGGFIEVDGLEVRAIECTIAGEDGGMAMLDLVFALADIQPAVDACAPDGDAVQVELRWSDETFEIELVRSALGRVDAECLGSAIASARWSHETTCSTVLLVGDPATAAQAADAWVPRPAD